MDSTDILRTPQIPMGGVEDLGQLAPHFYYSWVCVILIAALPSLTACTQMMYDHWDRLPPCIRGLCLPLAWDWWLVLGFLIRDCYTVNMRMIDQGTWCQLMGFVNIASVLTLRACAAINAYATARMVRGPPLADEQIFSMYGAAILGGSLLASLFLISDSYGPYKGLYCCLKETAYEPLATVPCFIVTLTSMGVVVYYYFQALTEKVKSNEDRVLIELLVRRGVIHGFAFYSLWSGIISAGVMTAMGGKVPLLFDIVAAWVVKLEPLVESLLIIQSINMIVSPCDGPGDCKEDAA